MTDTLSAAPQIVSIRRLDWRNYGDRARFVKDGVLVDGTVDHILRSGKRDYVLITVDGVGYALLLSSEVELTPAPGHPPVPHETAHPLPGTPAEPAQAGLVRIPAGNLDGTRVGNRISMRIGENETAGVLESVRDGAMMMMITVSGKFYALPRAKMVSVTPSRPMMSRAAFDVYYKELTTSL